jgi:predicted permease
MFTFFRRLRARLKYRHFERDLQKEIEIHRTLKRDELEASGVPPDDARWAAARALGNVTQVQEDARSIWIARWMQEVRQDVRYTLTTLRRQPVFCLAVIAVLGFGLGLVSTAHSVVDAMFLRPWQVPNAAQVHFVRSAAPAGSDFATISFPELRYLQQHSRSAEFIGATARAGQAHVFYGPEAFDRVSSVNVSANYFDLLGVRLAAGRAFLPSEDDHTTRVPVAIISEELWANRFDRDPSLIGGSVRIGSVSHTIVGIAPAGFLDPHDSRTGVWRPVTHSLTRTPDDVKRYADPRHATFPYSVITKVADGSTTEQATAELTGLSGQFRRTVDLPVYERRLRDTRPSIGGEEQMVAWLVLGALVLIQLVACANVGNLVLARSLTRQREMAVRLSLGAGRARLVRQLVTEVGVMSLVAAAVGIGLAYLIPSALVPFLPEDAPRAEFFWPGAATTTAALVMAILTALAAGLAPALRATRVNLSVVTGERHGPTIASARLQRVLLGTQVAVAALLLAGAGLFTRAITHASSTDPGFPMREYLEVAIEFPAGSQGPRRAALSQQLQAIVEAGGWPPLTLVDEAPMQARNDRGHFLRSTATGTLHFVPGRNVSGNYFDVIGRPLVAGRMPTAGNELVMNRTAAALLWSGEAPLGRTVVSGFNSQDSETMVVVGIAPDLPSSDFTRIGPVVYRPASDWAALVIVHSRDLRIGDRFNDLVNRLDPGVTATARPLEQTLDDVLEVPRIGSWVGWSIGGIGLTLAMIGAFGVFAQSVETRRREIGIRLALGAGGPQVVRLIVARTQGAVAGGIAAGLGIAAVGAAFLSSQLYGLSPLDPIAYLQVVALMAGSAAVATWIPARRATRVNPVDALRQD